MVIFSHHENKNCYRQLQYYCDEVVFPIRATFVLGTLQVYWFTRRYNLIGTCTNVPGGDAVWCPYSISTALKKKTEKYDIYVSVAFQILTCSYAIQMQKLPCKLFSHYMEMQPPLETNMGPF